MKLILVLITVLLTACACKPIKYVEDVAFMSAAEAGVENLPVFVDGKPCLDMDGKIGRCSKSIPDNKSISIKVPKRAYSYRYSLTATTGVKSIVVKISGQDDQILNFPNIKFDVPENAEIEIQILPDSFIPLFMLVGRISPDDRPEPISSFFRLVVSVYDHNYSEREIPFVYQDYLVLGEAALYTDVIYKDGKTKSFKKKTAVKIKGNSIKTAFSESYNMRFNFVDWE